MTHHAWMASASSWVTETIRLVKVLLRSDFFWRRVTWPSSKFQSRRSDWSTHHAAPGGGREAEHGVRKRLPSMLADEVHNLPGLIPVEPKTLPQGFRLLLMVFLGKILTWLSPGSVA